MIAGSARWNKKGRHIWTINFVDIANITDMKKVINTSVKTGNQGSLIKIPHHSRDADVFQKNTLLTCCEALQSGSRYIWIYRQKKVAVHYIVNTKIQQSIKKNKRKEVENNVGMATGTPPYDL